MEPHPVTDADVAAAWPAAIAQREIGATEAHLWRAPLDRVADRAGDFTTILAPEERQRVARFHKAVDGRRYGAARFVLRRLLAGYLCWEPEEVRFVYDDYSKPRLSEEIHSAPLQFSVSHSGGWALFGMVMGRNIGVDLEWIRSNVEVATLATRFFSPGEAEILRCLTGEAQLEAFFRCWTRKEAYMKARGQGLSYGLDRVEVTLQSHEPAAILSAADDPDVATHWTVQHLVPAAGYVGAAAVEAAQITFRCFTWDPDSQPAGKGRRPDGRA